MDRYRNGQRFRRIYPLNCFSIEKTDTKRSRPAILAESVFSLSGNKAEKHLRSPANAPHRTRLKTTAFFLFRPVEFRRLRIRSYVISPPSSPSRPRAVPLIYTLDVHPRTSRKTTEKKFRFSPKSVCKKKKKVLKYERVSCLKGVSPTFFRTYAFFSRNNPSS